MSTYGIMRDTSVTDIKNLINWLVAEGYLRLTNSQYPVLRLEPKAIAVLKKQDRVYQKRARQAETLVAKDDLFELLRKLRREIASREQVPPYIIFADSALQELARLLPTTAARFLAIKGVGESKLERYGTQFMNAIEQYIAARSIK